MTDDLKVSKKKPRIRQNLWVWKGISSYYWFFILLSSVDGFRDENDWPAWHD